MIELKDDLQLIVLASQQIRCRALLDDRLRWIPLEPKRPVNPHQQMVFVESTLVDATDLCCVLRRLLLLQGVFSHPLNVVDAGSVWSSANQPECAATLIQPSRIPFLRVW
jgi:hypothetical protein